jgi:hypothetical protein
MGMVLYVSALDSLDTTGDEDALVEAVIGPDAWDADKMWWAALDLLFGPKGINRLEATPVTEEGGYSPLMMISSETLTAIVDDLRSVDDAKIRDRFDNHEFGEALGPEVLPDDREWLCASAGELANVFREANSAHKTIYWMIA